ncbi:MAG: flagellar basal body-associated FliL family protein [Nitrospirae bacterium]|nr:flagellar basal body-associated FliL family protein [Nitrospirota bacterium]
MADAPAADEDVKAPAPRVAVVSIKMVIIIGAAALLLGLGVAFALFKMTSGDGAKAKSEAKAEGESHDAANQSAEGETKAGAVKGNGPGVIVDMEPFIINLADVQEVRYLKITIKLEVESQEASLQLAGRNAQMRDLILVLLSSKDSAAIRTTQGKFQLRDEITQRVNGLLSKPAVRTVYFTDFVVQ